MNFFIDVFKNKSLLVSLAVQDFKQRYLGNYLGIVWAFASPFITVFILFFVFQIGFRSAPSEGIPFIIWFISGMFPWFFCQNQFRLVQVQLLINPILLRR